MTISVAGSAATDRFRCPAGPVPDDLRSSDKPRKGDQPPGMNGVTPPARAPQRSTARKTAAPLSGESVSRDQLCHQELPKASTCVQRITKTNTMKTIVLLVALAAYVAADGAHHGADHGHGHQAHHAPAAPIAPAAPKPAAHHAPVHHAPAPAAPVNHGSYSAPAAPAQDQQGYYYYYYPVQDEKTTGLFDFKKYDVATIVIVGIVVVGVALLGLSLFTVTTGRSIEPITMSYDQMYDVAMTVYDALKKEY
ncbi:uncharacterized protein LOC125040424 [Penaeus chinensis]|uniref:uncharacterized protein LOC125040424 n=1 Tax=Penaeus chinensis TaxID=139456 RepID=UPI001FB77E9E|nr:uncharacterized protein LOC125040424 [Penaeus chinensis]